MENYSHSRIACYMMCPEKYRLRYIDHVVPTKKAKPLALGSCMAEGLASFREEGDQEAAQEVFMKTWVDGDRVLEVSKEDDPLRSVERGLEILNEYMLTYPDDPKEFIHPEVRFDEEIMDGVRFRGRIDGIIAIGDDVALVEDKTASRLGPFYFKQLGDSYQIKWYMAIAKKLGLFDLSKKKVPRCLMNVSYIHPTTFRFERQITPKTGALLDESLERLKDWIRQIQFATREMLFPKGDSETCLKYGGCEYLPLRDASPSIKASLLKNEYMIEEPSTGERK